MIFVIRGDGAVAKFGPADDQIDFGAIRSAIQEAENWRESHSTPTPVPTVATPTPVVDYSDYYNKFWKEAVIENPFYKTTNERGNSVYIGVTRQAAKQFKNTIVIEHVGSQDEAARLYKDAVAKAASDGYVNRAFNFPANPPNLIERWQGDKGLYSYIYAAYYYDYGANSWVFEKQYV